MAASAWRMYRTAKKYIMGADLDMNAAAMRIMLLKGTAAANVSNYTRSTWASLVGLSQPANIPNSAILSLVGVALTAVAGSNTYMFDATARIFTASGGDATSIQYAVIGVSGGKALGWCKLSTAAFTVTSGNTLTITPPATGIFLLSGGAT